MQTSLTFTRAAILAALLASPLPAQTPLAEPDPMVASIQAAAAHINSVFTKASHQMSEEDYAFKPTAEVRSFGQLLAHVAETNYWFCAAGMGEKAPVSGIEKSRTTKAAIQLALAESFAYCDRAFAAMTDDAKAKAMTELRGKAFPALAVLNFRNHHSLLHWGNSITYMRIRGKVPPSA